MSDIQDESERRKEDREISIINLMKNETEKRLIDVIRFKESYLQEEKELLFKIEFLNNLLISKNIDVMTTIQINEKGEVKVLYNKDDMIIPSSIN